MFIVALILALLMPAFAFAQVVAEPVEAEIASEKIPVVSPRSGNAGEEVTPSVRVPDGSLAEFTVDALVPNKEPGLVFKVTSWLIINGERTPFGSFLCVTPILNRQGKETDKCYLTIQARDKDGKLVVIPKDARIETKIERNKTATLGIDYTISKEAAK